MSSRYTLVYDGSEHEIVSEGSINTNAVIQVLRPPDDRENGRYERLKVSHQRSEFREYENGQIRSVTFLFLEPIPEEPAA